MNYPSIIVKVMVYMGRGPSWPSIIVRLGYIFLIQLQPIVTCYYQPERVTKQYSICNTVTQWVNNSYQHLTVVCIHIMNVARIQIRFVLSCCLCYIYSRQWGSFTVSFPFPNSWGWSCRIIPVGDLIVWWLLNFEWCFFFLCLYPFLVFYWVKKSILSLWNLVSDNKQN